MKNVLSWNEIVKKIQTYGYEKFCLNCQSGNVAKVFDKAIARFAAQGTKKLYVTEFFLEQNCATVFTKTREDGEEFV